jgi:predicted nucleic acid-binding protein
MTAAWRAGRAFVDASAFFALLDASDNSHEAAVAVQRQLVSERYRLLTSNFVLAETLVLILSRLGRRLATRYLEQMDASAITIERVTAGDEREAKALFRRYDDRISR